MKKNCNALLLWDKKSSGTAYSKVPLIMKSVFYAFLFGSVGISYASESYAQTTMVSIDIKDQTVYDVLNEIENTTEYSFFYNTRHVDLDKKVSVSVNGGDIFEVLDEVFEGTNITYTVKDKNIVLSLKRQESRATQNTLKIKGNVVDKDGIPIIGANVKVKGTSNGTITDLDGNFVLEVENGAVLEVSFIGYITQTLKASDKLMNIVLKDDTQKLDEVVVVGYATQKKESLSSAVSAVSGEDLQKRPSQNLQTALQGTTPGLTVWNKGGEPGENSVAFRVRGVTSMSGNESDLAPLVIVDGIEQSYNDINPSDIASISVLKDASSTAIYGSRAANGVILITTKRGESGKFRVKYNFSLDLQNLTVVPEHMSTLDYLNLQNVAYSNRPGGKPVYSEEEIQKYVSEEDLLHYPKPNDWFNQLIQKNAPMQNHNITISGGSDKLKTIASFNYFSQEGVVPNRDAKRYSVRLNNDYKLLSNLKLAADFNLKRNTRTGTLNSGGIYHRMIHGSQFAVPVYPDGTYGLSKQGWNPILLADPDYAGERKTVDDYGIMNLKADWEIVKNLSFSTQYGVEIMKRNTQEFTPTYEVRDYWNKDNILKIGPSKNSLKEYRLEYLQSTWNNILTYNFNIADKHKINLLGGYSEILYKQSSLTALGYDYYNNSLRDLSQSELGTREVNSAYPEWGLRSVFGRINYSYLDKYLFEMNMRYDGSSRFAKGNRYAFFPSFSVAWRISEEKFWEKIKDAIPSLKIRSSWGLTGNSNVVLYSYIPDLQLDNYYVFNGNLAQGVKQSTLASEDITWETTAQFDIGLDASFLNNKLMFTFDWYKKHTTDILLDLPIPGVVGLDPAPTNAGVIDNKGWETSLTYRDQIGKLSYSLSFNLSDVKNKIVDRAGAGPTYSSEKNWIVNKEGEEFNSLWGYRCGGYLTQEDFDNGYPVFSPDAKPGDLKYLDLNNDGVITADDKDIIGSTIPRFVYGFDAMLNWKGFDLNIQFQGVGKQDMAVMGAYVEAGSWEGFALEIAKDYWTPENTDARFPRPQKQNNKNTEASDFWVVDASYLRLKNLQLGYTLPSKISKKFFCERLRFFVGGTNLLTFSELDDWGMDSEAPTGRGDYYPVLKTWSFGLNVEF